MEQNMSAALAGPGRFEEVNTFAAESPPLAQSMAKEFAAWVRENRDQFVCTPRSAKDAVKETIDEPVKQGCIGSNEVKQPLTIDESLAVLASAGQALSRNYGFLPDADAISGTMQPFDAGHMKLVGFDPNDYRAIVVKSASHFRAWRPAVDSLTIDPDPPGSGSNDLWSFKFQNKLLKLYPLDKDAVYATHS